MPSDLAAMGFDARWGVVSAADTGAPHRRERIWILATDAMRNGCRERQVQHVGRIGQQEADFGNDGEAEFMAFAAYNAYRTTYRFAGKEQPANAPTRGTTLAGAVKMFPTATATASKGWSKNHNRANSDDRLDYTIEREAQISLE